MFNVKLAALAAMAVATMVVFMGLNLRGNIAFAMELRSVRIAALVQVAVAIAISTVVFQTITGNKILTPSIMGMDALYVFLQTALVFTLGGVGFSALDDTLKFSIEVLVMSALTCCLVLPLLRYTHAMMLTLLGGIILGVLFRSLSSLLSRLVDPNDFAVVQGVSYANFNSVETGLLLPAALFTLVALIVCWRSRHVLDVFLLGKPAAIGLGVNWNLYAVVLLVLVGTLVAVSTALAGPVTFLGLLVVALAEKIIGTQHHTHMLVASCLVGIILLVGGQTILTHLFANAVPIGILVEFAGGITFLSASFLQAARMISLDTISVAISGTPIIRGISLTIDKGGITALIGPNEAGKSTLLGAVARLLPVSGGSVHVDGMDVTKSPSRDIARLMAVMPQDNNIAARLRVRELVQFGRFPHHQGSPAAHDHRMVDEAIELFDLTQIADRFVDSLSGGQRQRARAAMCYAQETDYILLDEPLNNLDIFYAGELMRTLKKVADQNGRTIIIVLHDINYAAVYADRIIAMRDGTIVADGKAEAVMKPDVLKQIFDVEINVETYAGKPVSLHFL